MKFKSRFPAVITCFVLLLGYATEVRPAEGTIQKIPVREIAPDIYLFRDICNVYILKSGSSALLIDSGSGEITGYLEALGIKKADWVFHTHYHRDQCIGSVKLKQSGTKIAIGESEADLLDTPGQNAPFQLPVKPLLNGELPGWGARMAPFHTPGIDKRLIHGDVFDWNGYRITTIQTPGHTKGSNSFMVEANGQRLCFTGDLIMDGGHARDLYSMQWIYLQNPGVDSSLVSLDRIKNSNADMLLPAHGEVIKDPLEQIELLSLRLSKVKDAFDYTRAGRWNWSQFVQVSKHVIQDGGSTSQIIISETGEALLFDCGREFSLERLKEAKSKFGISRIDVIIPSHWHYDHIDGIEDIVKAEGAEVWVWDGLAEHLMYPERFPTTCWTGKSIPADRILKEGETFSWGGYFLKVYHHPVHTEQQMGLHAKVDGLDFYLIADGLSYTKDGHLRSPLHCYNEVFSASGLIKSARSFVQASPYLCLPAHSNVFAVGPDDKYEYLDWSVKTTDNIRSLLMPPYPDLGYNPYWASFYPARTQARVGEEVTKYLRLKNHTGRKINGSFTLKTYGDIVCDSKKNEYELEPGETKDFPVIIKNKKPVGKGIHIITADIEFGGDIFGEFPQAYIELYE